MKKLLALLFCLFATSAYADGTYYVATTGNDSNDCLSAEAPCRTWQHAFDLCSLGSICNVNVADGVYEETPSINYYKMIGVTGNCADFTAVTLVGLFTAQDHSIAGLTCAQVKGVYTRQFAIMDYSFVTFSDNPGGMHVLATEMSKINCLTNDYSAGSATYHFAATDKSTIMASCTMTVIGTQNFSAFGYAIQQSLINASGGVSTGINTGTKCLLGDSSIIANGNILPGSGSC